MITKYKYGDNAEYFNKQYQKIKDIVTMKSFEKMIERFYSYKEHTDRWHEAIIHHLETREENMITEYNEHMREHIEELVKTFKEYDGDVSKVERETKDRRDKVLKKRETEKLNAARAAKSKKGERK